MITKQELQPLTNFIVLIESAMCDLAEEAMKGENKAIEKLINSLWETRQICLIPLETEADRQLVLGLVRARLYFLAKLTHQYEKFELANRIENIRYVAFATDLITYN